MKQAWYAAVKDIIGFDEILITGGEPMLDPARTADITNRLKWQNPGAKTYLYTAKYSAHLWALALMCHFDGMQFSLHADATSEDLKDFHDLQNALYYRRRSIENKSFRLYVDSRLFGNVTVNPALWSRVEMKPWLTEDQLLQLNASNNGLPSGETLFILRD
jgi:organic radical activating enzyme